MKSKEELAEGALEAIQEQLTEDLTPFEKMAMKESFEKGYEAAERLIPVEETLPKYNQFVLFVQEGKHLKTRTFYLGWLIRATELTSSKDEWYAGTGQWFKLEEVTHWRPLPPLP